MLALLLGCSRPEPRPVVPATVDVGRTPPSASASTPPSASSAPVAPPAPPACEANEWIAAPTDVTWAKRVSDAMRAGIPRKKLACWFGTLKGSAGSMAELTPRAAAFKSVRIDVRQVDHPEEAVDVTFADGAMPTLAAVEKLLGPSKETRRIHFDSPHQRIIYMTAPTDVSLRAIATMEDAKSGRVRELRLDVSDLRGWKTPGVKCWDGVELTVQTPEGDRFPSGKWTFRARDVAAGGSLGEFVCRVPEDALDIGKCEPQNREEPPGAIESAMASSIGLHLATTTATKIEVTILHDDTLFAKRVVDVKISSSPAQCIDSGTWTHGSTWVLLRKR